MPEGSTRFIVADTEEEIANDYLSMIRISNEAIDDEGDEWRRCKECGQWKPLSQMTGAVYLSYPGQYDCKECAKNLFNKKPEIKTVNHKPITASKEELSNNSRSKCAKLRIAEKLPTAEKGGR